ncbi:TIGR03086 family metal-binding protein [Nocardia implantans]|uniref:TIGR03086 family metal-binding protein n=1 Tax=Nocardia implantans TaxID=3108168 RepID=A0ABU6B3Q4_9NOCA|nr:MULTISPECIES: TIGR03086 family metal-binding protein [unclassified Nocardia]MBF6196052.1 TIGR03086 family protein [Nocardia beijingensis]MEA3532575.1 TIGR03086 family metal-binding protein [Nocardia sp. CDC192]MEB3514392.1 TIGR03086 family metal-binding protein [Nocardia sp. CDC186]
MEPEFDFEPAAAALATVVGGIADDRLAAPTPCADTTVRDLLAHVVDLTEAFRQAATKEAVGGSVAPAPPAERALPEDWRERIPAQLDALVTAWREPAAWDGVTEAGGVSEPAPVMARIALDEVVVHGWDLAKATGQTFSCAAGDLATLLDLLRDTPAEGVPGLFGPVLPVTADATALERVLALTGRRADWTAQDRGAVLG